MVTLITDWNSVFYRKYHIYKKRVDAELAIRRDKYKQSITEAPSSQIDGSSMRYKNFDDRQTEPGGFKQWNYSATTGEGQDISELIRAEK